MKKCHTQAMKLLSMLFGCLIKCKLNYVCERNTKTIYIQKEDFAIDSEFSFAMYSASCSWYNKKVTHIQNLWTNLSHNAGWVQT